MKFTNKKFKKGKLIISALSLVLTICICIPFVRNQIFASTNSVTFKFNLVGEYGYIRCNELSAVYNGKTYTNDDNDNDVENNTYLYVKDVQFNDNKDGFGFVDDDSVLYERKISEFIFNDDEYDKRARYLNVVFDSKYFLDEDGNTLEFDTPNYEDAFSNITLDFSNIPDWPFNSYKVIGKEGKLFSDIDGISYGIDYFFVLYNEEDIIYTYHDDHQQAGVFNSILEKGTDTYGSIDLPSYKSYRSGMIISKYSDVASTEFRNEVDPHNFLLDRSKIIFSVYNKFMASFDNINKKVVTNVSPYWEIPDGLGGSVRADSKVTYQWKKIDLSKGYKVLNYYDDSYYGEMVKYQDPDDGSIDIDVSFFAGPTGNEKTYDAVTHPLETPMGDGSTIFMLALMFESDLFEKDGIIELTLDRPLDELILNYGNQHIPSFAFTKYNMEGTKDVSISNDRKTIFYKIDQEDEDVEYAMLQIISEIDYKITGINYYPPNAIEDIEGATSEELPSNLDTGLYTCMVTISGDCFDDGNSYSVYSSPVQIGYRVTMLPNYKNVTNESSIKQKDMIVPENAPLPHCYYQTYQYNNMGRIFLGWSYEPNGNVLLDNVKITKDTILYAIWKDVTELTYDKKTKHFDIEPSVLWLDEEDGLQVVLEGLFPTNLITKQTLIYKNYSAQSTENNNEEDIGNYYLSYIDNLHNDIEIGIVKEDDYSIKQGEKFTFSFLEGTEAHVNQIEISEYNDTDTLFNEIIYDTDEGDQIPKDLHYEVKNNNVNLEVFISSHSLEDIKKVKVVPYVDDDINGNKNKIVLAISDKQDLDNFDVGSYEIVYFIDDNDFNSIYANLVTLNITDTRPPEGGGGSGGSSHKKKTKETKVDNKVEIKMYIGKNEAIVNGIKKYLDTAPFIEDDRTFLPVRFVSENLRANVSWDKVLRKVTVTNNDTTIIFTIGSDIALVNDKEIKLDTKAFIKDDRTFIPIRFVSENLGCNVVFEKEQKEVSIKEKDNK